MKSKILLITLYLATFIAVLAAQPIEISLQDPARGVIQLVNGFAERNLSECDIDWLLLENGHLIEAVTIKNIAGEPGSIVQVEFPYSSKPFRYGGERWIRIEVREKETDGKKGKLLSWEQIKLSETTSPPPRPFGANLMPKINYWYTSTRLKANNKIFSVEFSKKTGLIESLVYQKKERIESGPILTFGPTAEPLTGELISIDHSMMTSNKLAVSTHIRYKSKIFPVMDHFVDYFIYGDGSMRIDSRIQRQDREDRIPLAGIHMMIKNATKFSWYGSQPTKSYSDTRWGNPIQVYSSNASNLKKEKNSSGPISNIRWIGLTSKFCKGIIFCHINTYLRSVINIKDNDSAELFIAPNNPTQTEGTQVFSMRMRGFDSILDFADRLWYVEVPAETANTSGK